MTHTPARTDDARAQLRALVERAQRYLAWSDNPKWEPCPRCNGKGHHHGFGEHGHDPDWCAKCGGPGVQPTEPGTWNPDDILREFVAASLLVDPAGQIIEKLNERIEELRAPEEVDALLDKLHVSEKRLTDVAVALGYPKEMASLSGYAIADHAKATHDALVQAQQQIADMTRKGEAREEALRKFVEEHIAVKVSSGDEYARGWNNAMHNVRNALLAQSSPADKEQPQENKSWLLCPHCLHRWDAQGSAPDEWESCPNCHGRFSFIKPRAIAAGETPQEKP